MMVPCLIIVIYDHILHVLNFNLYLLIDKAEWLFNELILTLTIVKFKRHNVSTTKVFHSLQMIIKILNLTYTNYYWLKNSPNTELPISVSKLSDVTTMLFTGENNWMYYNHTCTHSTQYFSPSLNLFSWQYVTSL